MKILVNKARCRNCGELLESKNSKRDYKFCKCGAVGVNGGTEAIMRLGHHINIEELSVKEYYE